MEQLALGIPANTVTNGELLIEDKCHVCKCHILEDGTGVGVTWIHEGQVKHQSYHGNCYNAERLKERVKNQSDRTSQHEASSEN